MSKPAWTTRMSRPGDDAGILALRRATFGEVDPVRLRPDVWRWQFVENPAGPGYIRVAEHDGTIVGQYAAIPTRFRMGTDLRVGTDIQVGTDRALDRTFAMSCDTMTHPDYQRQGMFVRLARELYDEIAARENVSTVWGFPNPASHPGFVGKLGWFDIHEFPTYVKPLRSAPVLARYVGPGGLARGLGAVADGAYRLIAPRAREPRRATIEPVAWFDERFDALWERHAGLAGVVQVRDRAYLDWRYCAVPMFEYRPFTVTVAGALEGYVVLRSVTLFDLPVCAVVDLFPCPIVDAAVTREVLAFAQRHAAAHGAAFLTAILPPRHARHLTRFGFLPVPRFMNPRPFRFGARCAPVDASLLGNVDHWYVTYGDSDIV